MTLREKRSLRKFSKAFMDCIEVRTHGVTGILIDDAAYKTLLIPCPNMKAKRIGENWLISIDQMDGLSIQIEGWLHREER